MNKRPRKPRKRKPKNKVQASVAEVHTPPLADDMFLATRQSYDAQLLEMSGRFDKWILTLSGGALAISITFIKEIAPNPDPDTLIWIKLAWGSITASMVFALLSLMTSQQAIRECMQELDNSYREGRGPNPAFPRGFSNLTNALNWLSVLGFLIGVGLLCVFSFLNFDLNTTL